MNTLQSFDFPNSVMLFMKISQTVGK